MLSRTASMLRSRSQGFFRSASSGLRSQGASRADADRNLSGGAHTTCVTEGGSSTSSGNSSSSSSSGLLTTSTASSAAANPAGRPQGLQKLRESFSQQIREFGSRRGLPLSLQSLSEKFGGFGGISDDKAKTDADSAVKSGNNVKEHTDSNYKYRRKEGDTGFPAAGVKPKAASSSADSKTSGASESSSSRSPPSFPQPPQQPPGDPKKGEEPSKKPENGLRSGGSSGGSTGSSSTGSGSTSGSSSSSGAGTSSGTSSCGSSGNSSTGTSSSSSESGLARGLTAFGVGLGLSVVLPFLHQVMDPEDFEELMQKRKLSGIDGGNEIDSERRKSATTRLPQKVNAYYVGLINRLLERREKKMQENVQKADAVDTQLRGNLQSNDARKDPQVVPVRGVSTEKKESPAEKQLPLPAVVPEKKELPIVRKPPPIIRLQEVSECVVKHEAQLESKFPKAGLIPPPLEIEKWDETTFVWADDNYGGDSNVTTLVEPVNDGIEVPQIDVKPEAAVHDAALSNDSTTQADTTGNENLPAAETPTEAPSTSGSAQEPASPQNPPENPPETPPESLFQRLSSKARREKTAWEKYIAGKEQEGLISPTHRPKPSAGPKKSKVETRGELFGAAVVTPSSGESRRVEKVDEEFKKVEENGASASGGGGAGRGVAVERDESVNTEAEKGLDDNERAAASEWEEYAGHIPVTTITASLDRVPEGKIEEPDAEPSVVEHSDKLNRRNPTGEDSNSHHSESHSAVFTDSTSSGFTPPPPTTGKTPSYTNSKSTPPPHPSPSHPHPADVEPITLNDIERFLFSLKITIYDQFRDGFVATRDNFYKKTQEALIRFLTPVVSNVAANLLEDEKLKDQLHSTLKSELDRVLSDEEIAKKLQESTSDLTTNVIRSDNVKQATADQLGDIITDYFSQGSTNVLLGQLIGDALAKEYVQNQAFELVMAACAEQKVIDSTGVLIGEAILYPSVQENFNQGLLSAGLYALPDLVAETKRLSVHSITPGWLRWGEKNAQGANGGSKNAQDANAGEGTNAGEGSSSASGGDGGDANANENNPSDTSAPSTGAETPVGADNAGATGTGDAVKSGDVPTAV